MFTLADQPDSSSTPKNARRGGWRTHKPDCKCHPCAAHRRAAEAVPVPTGDGGATAASEAIPEPSIEPTPRGPRPTKYNTRDKSPRARIAMWLAVRSVEPGITNKDIADRMGISVGYLRELIYTARKEGWLNFSDPMDQIEYGIIPKVVENLNYFLDKKDKSVTIEAAKGTIFKQYQESKGISDAPRTVLALKIETPSSEDTPAVVTGHIVGKPRQID